MGCCLIQSMDIWNSLFVITPYSWIVAVDALYMLYTYAWNCCIMPTYLHLRQTWSVLLHLGLVSILANWFHWPFSWWSPILLKGLRDVSYRGLSHCRGVWLRHIVSACRSRTRCWSHVGRTRLLDCLGLSSWRKLQEHMFVEFDKSLPGTEPFQKPLRLVY